MEFVPGTADPPVTRDRGAGQWNSEPRTAEMILKKAGILNYLPHAAVVIGDDAAKHLLHYLMNTGTAYTIDFEDMIDSVALTRKYLGVEIDLAKEYVETLPPGTHYFTSSKIMPNLYAHKDQSVNWYFAIGGYSAWGKGAATVSAFGGRRSYSMDFEYKFFDRYNWDGGKKVSHFGVTITDEFMGRFHREGLAKEFDCWGSVRRKVTWMGAAPVAPVKPLPDAGAAAKTHVVQTGDSLSKIAGYYYGNIHQWPKIYQANRAVVGPNPNLILPGQKLVIP